MRATPGGRHPDQGTRNALIALGPTAYLEVIGIDPDGAPPGRPRWFGLDELAAPRLVAWAAATDDLDAAVARARAAGVPLGEVLAGRRRRSDGSLLAWRFTDPRANLEGGVVPFLIDWAGSAHPARDAARGCQLVGLEARHPEPARAAAMLDAMGVELTVRGGPAPGLVARVRCPRGVVEIA